MSHPTTGELVALTAHPYYDAGRRIWRTESDDAEWPRSWRGRHGLRAMVDHVQSFVDPRPQPAQRYWLRPLDPTLWFRPFNLVWAERPDTWRYLMKRARVEGEADRIEARARAERVRLRPAYDPRCLCTEYVFDWTCLCPISLAARYGPLDDDGDFQLQIGVRVLPEG